MLVNMNDVLLPAKKGGYGVGFFNAVNVETVSYTHLDVYKRQA